MSIIGKSYLISLVRGKTGLLRIPEELAKDLTDLGIHTSINCICSNRDGHKLSVRINTEDKTIVGLDPWLRDVKDEDVKSLSLEGKSDSPCSFGINFSKESPPPVGDMETFEICRPEQGLYLGGKLSAQFYELIRTNEPVVVNESDLLRHVFICGSTGSGKTVLAKVLIEEAALKGIPVIALDLVGDISSMAILPPSEDPAELARWVTSKRDESREDIAAITAANHKANLDRWGLSYKDVQEFRKKVAVNVFTPCSNAGFRLALSAFVEPPEELENLKETDPDSFEEIIRFINQVAHTFVSRLSLTRRQADKAKGYIYEVIKTFWDRGISLRGHEGIKRVIHEIMTGEAGIEQIGGKATSDYISRKDRENISDAINTLLTGDQKLWFQGFPADIETFTNPKFYNGKTPITVINIEHLKNFKDRAYVIGYMAYLICSWMQGRGGIDEPRLIFYIDEIAGSGSREAFFPSTALSPSKPALNLLLRLGRGYGVCCMFATQSPGDIDYKAMSQCGTWIVGQLSKQRERKKVEEGVGIAGSDFESIARHMPNFQAGHFLLKTPTLPLTMFNGRWIMQPIHRRLSKEYLEKLKEDYEKEVCLLFEEAQKYANSNNALTAKNLLESVISGYRFSTLCPKAYLLLGKVLYDMSDYDNAIKKLNDMLKNRMEAEETGEAYFLLGKCKEQQEKYSEAVCDFTKVSASAANDEIKASAFRHKEYCNNRSTWPQLTGVQKLLWWILGSMPDGNVLIGLEDKDKELLEHQFKSILHEQDFAIPEPIDFKTLAEASKKAAAEQHSKSVEQIKAERWSGEQVSRIEAFLEEKMINEAHSVCVRIVQRLNDTAGRATPSIISVLNKFNKICIEKTQALNKKVLMFEARQYEFEIANLFRLKGYTSFVTRSTGDDGIDVFASNDNEKIIIQCKRWKRPVGRDKIDELAGVKNRYKAHRAILATTSCFSDDAKRAGRENGIELWDFLRIKNEWKDALRAKTSEC